MFSLPSCLFFVYLNRWVRHTPGERNISNESAVCGEQIITAIASIIILKSLSPKNSLLSLVFNRNNEENEEGMKNILNILQIAVGSLITIFSGIWFWKGLGHLDIIMCSAIWEAKNAFISYFIALVFWLKLIPKHQNMKLNFTCTQWLGIMLIIFGLIELERVNRQEAHDEISLSQTYIDMATEATTTATTNEGEVADTNVEINEPIDSITNNNIANNIISDVVTSTRRRLVDIISKNEDSSELESTVSWESSHHEGFITMILSAILYGGNLIHAQMQVIQYKTDNAKKEEEILKTQQSSSSLIPKNNDNQTKNKSKKMNQGGLNEERQKELIVLWSFIFKRSIVGILFSFFLVLYNINTLKGRGSTTDTGEEDEDIEISFMSALFEGFDFITIFAIILNAFGNIYIIGLSIDLFSSVISLVDEENDKNDKNVNNNNNIINKTMKKRKEVVNIPSLSSGISMMITFVFTVLFLGSSGINMKIIIGFCICVYGTLLHGGVLGNIGNNSGNNNNGGTTTFSSSLENSLSLFAPSDEEFGEVGIQNGQFVVNS